MVEVCTIVGIEQNQEATIIWIVASVYTAMYRLAASSTVVGLVSWAGLVQLVLGA